MTGQTIAQYEILEQLGQGGMGIVYKARDTKLDRIVALKFLPASVSSDPDTKERFMQEARAASALDDPYICTIHDIAQADDGQLFIVMAFYDGDTLKYRIDRSEISVTEAASIARQIALGLSSAHEAGIVHRDVKPANIMVTSKGQVKILDFGVAKLGENSLLTREGSTVGTAAYMSPEQARSESVDARSDIWSIGAVLYEMISGKRPFGGGYEAAVAYSILNEDPPPLTDIPDGLKSIVDKALSKQVGDRYSSAVDLANDLAEFSHDSVVSMATRPALDHTTTTASSPHGIVVKFAIGAVLVLGALYTAMIALGLPDWVFPAGVLLAMIGLPIVVYGASLDRKRASLDSGERKQLTGLRSWLTTKRAFQGGALAAAALLISILGFVGLRSAGIGPFATLISGGTLSTQDAIIVSDFQNETDDESLGMTVTESFRIDLSQSSAVRMLDRSQVKGALTRMQLNPDTAITSDIALQVAEREGIKAIIEGEIRSAGASYTINARIIDATDGAQLAAFRESAASDSDILSAIDQLSASLREGVGESLVDIRASEPLSQVTTSNTEALRLYTEAESQSSAGDLAGSIDKLERVIELDSTFAMAYRKLAVNYANTGEPGTIIDRTITRGYNHRDRLPFRERLLTEAYYYSRVEDDDEKEAQAYEEVLRKFPYEVPALNNLAIYYQNNNRNAEAETLLRRALEVEEGWTFRSNLVITIANQGDRDRAFGASQDFEEAIPGSIRAAQFRMYLEFLDDNMEGAETWLDSVAARNRGTIFDEIQVLDDRDNLMMAQGRLAEGREYHKQMSTLYRSRQDWDALERTENRTRKLDSLSMEFDLEWERALLTGDNSKLQSAFSATLKELESAGGLPDDDDGPRAWIAMVFASTGDMKKATEWREKHRAYHAESGEENSPWGRMVDAYVDTKNGGDPDEGIRLIQKATEDMGCASNGCWSRLMGQIEESRGNIEAAIDYYEHGVDGYRFFKLRQDEGLIALDNFKLGILNEQLGNTDEAIRRYTYMAERWKNADNELQPQVAEAHRRIETLLDRKAREQN